MNNATFTSLVCPSPALTMSFSITSESNIFLKAVVVCHTQQLPLNLILLNKTVPKIIYNFCIPPAKIFVPNQLPRASQKLLVYVFVVYVTDSHSFDKQVSNSWLNK